MAAPNDYGIMPLAATMFEGTGTGVRNLNIDSISKTSITISCECYTDFYDVIGYAAHAHNSKTNYTNNRFSKGYYGSSSIVTVSSATKNWKPATFTIPLSNLGTATEIYIIIGYVLSGNVYGNYPTYATSVPTVLINLGNSLKVPTAAQWNWLKNKLMS